LIEFLFQQIGRNRQRVIAIGGAHKTAFVAAAQPQAGAKSLHRGQRAYKAHLSEFRAQAFGSVARPTSCVRGACRHLQRRGVGIWLGATPLPFIET